MGMVEQFPGFSWCVPAAFSDPLGTCRFEAGDLLYDTPDAYQQWSEALKTLTFSVQVSSPKKSIGGNLGDDDADVFSRNWGSEVIFELTDFKRGKRKQVVTTQGRLYTLLWKGDFGGLDESIAAPPVPLLVSAAHQYLIKEA
jgi:hypothetical protein